MICRYELLECAQSCCAWCALMWCQEGNEYHVCMVATVGAYIQLQQTFAMHCRLQRHCPDSTPFQLCSQVYMAEIHLSGRFSSFLGQHGAIWLARRLVHNSRLTVKCNDGIHSCISRCEKLLAVNITVTCCHAACHCTLMVLTCRFPPTVWHGPLVWKQSCAVLYV